jgi:hypothetical protein
MHRQRQHVVATLAQRCGGQGKHVQAVIEVFAETSCRDFAAQVAVRGRQLLQTDLDLKGDSRLPPRVVLERLIAGMSVAAGQTDRARAVAVAR